MTPEAQRIAIAEVCPVIKQDRGFWFYRQKDENGIPYWHACKNNDPLSDLNAMHEAEKVLSETQIDNYGLQLNTIMHRDAGLSEHPRHYCDWNASATQRAEAFLRTLNNC